MSAEPKTLEIETTRFGAVQFRSDRVIYFGNGLLGFPEMKRFTLFQANDETYFYWLQSLDAPSLAWVVTDPGLWFKDYHPWDKDGTQCYGLPEPLSPMIFVICNKRGEQITANLQGPLVIDVPSRRAAQFVLSNPKWHTRVPLLSLQP